MFEIYITTNLINGKKYIGQHKIVENKKDYYLGSGKLLKEAIEKYGKENFIKETIDYCETLEEANQKEKFYIALLDAIENENFYNLAAGGIGGGFIYYNEYLQSHPEEYDKILEKRKQALKQWQLNNPETLSQLGKQNIQKCLEWCKNHPEEIQKIYEENKEENIKRLKKWMEENPEQTKANREKGYQALQKWKEEHPEEVKKNLALGPQANKLKNGKKVRCITTGEIFLSIREAEKAYNLYKDAVGRCLRGIIKTAGKHPVTGEKLYWEYYEENNT